MILLIPLVVSANGHEDYTVVKTMEDVSVHKVFTVEFNTKLDIATVNCDTIYILDDKGEKVESHVALKSDEKRAIITTKNALDYNEDYTLVVTDNIKSESGVKAVSGYKVNFDTQNR